MECCQPLGGSTRCGHMTGRLANRLSGINLYKSHCGPGLEVIGLLSVLGCEGKSSLSTDSHHRPDPPGSTPM